MWLLRSKSFLKLCQRTVFFVALFILVGIFLLQVTVTVLLLWSFYQAVRLALGCVNSCLKGCNRQDSTITCNLSKPA